MILKLLLALCTLTGAVMWATYLMVGCCGWYLRWSDDRAMREWNRRNQ